MRRPDPADAARADRRRARGRRRGDNVRELLDDLMGRFPARTQLIEDDEIAPFVNVYVEGEDVRTLDGLETPVRRRLDGDPAAGDGRRLLDHGPRALASSGPTNARSTASCARASIRAAPTGCSSSSPRSGRSRASWSSTSAPATRAMRSGSSRARPEGDRARPGARHVELARAPWPKPVSRRWTSSRPGSRRCPRRRERRLDLVPRRARPRRRSSAGFAECARVLRPGGRMVAYVTLRDRSRSSRARRAELFEALAHRREIDGDRQSRRRRRPPGSRSLEDRARRRVARADDRGRRVGSGRELLRFSRLRRRSVELVEPVRRHASRRVRGRTLLGRLPAARQALPDRLRLAAPCVAARPLAARPRRRHTARRAAAPLAGRRAASTRSSRARTRPARSRTASPRR